MDEANSVVVSGGVVTVSEADAIQDISEYAGVSSNYDISDTAAAILSGGDAILDVTEFDLVTVTDGPVLASDGATLTEYSASISFDVRDTADAIAAEVVGTGNADDLDDARYVYVSGGDVTVNEASAIQNISGYQSYSSNYDITDDADNVLAVTGSPTVLQVSGDVTATNVDSKEDALVLKNHSDVDNFTLDTSAILTQLSGSDATVDEALALLQSSSGASNGLTDESAISITDTVSELDNHFSDLNTSGSLENVANVKATLASVSDAEAFVGDLASIPSGATYYNSGLSSLIDEFELEGSLLTSVSNFQDLTVSEALSVLQATNASSIPSITIEDTYANLTASDASAINSGLSSDAVPTILANGVTIGTGASAVNFSFKDVHVKDVNLTQAIDLNNNYPNVDFSYSLASGEFSSSNFTDASIDTAEALVGATNFPGTSILTISDTAENVIAADGDFPCHCWLRESHWGNSCSGDNTRSNGRCR